MQYYPLLDVCEQISLDYDSITAWSFPVSLLSRAIHGHTLIIVQWGCFILNHPVSCLEDGLYLYIQNVIAFDVPGTPNSNFYNRNKITNKN